MPCSPLIFNGRFGRTPLSINSVYTVTPYLFRPYLWLVFRWYIRLKIKRLNCHAIYSNRTWAPCSYVLSNLSFIRSNSEIYGVIHKPLRNFRSLRYSSRDSRDRGGGGTCQQREWLLPSGETCKYSTTRISSQRTWRDSLPIDMVLSAMSLLVVALPSSEVPEGLMNHPVHKCRPRG
jgi:hypothetical protein